MSGRQTPSLTLRLSLKLSFFIKFIVRDGSGGPETSHSWTAIGPDCLCQTFSSFCSLFPLLFPNKTLCTFGIILVINIVCVSFEWCYGVCFTLFLSSQTTGGHPCWFWFWWRFLPVKRELFLSTVASCMLRTNLSFGAICQFPSLRNCFWIGSVCMKLGSFWI